MAGTSSWKLPYQLLPCLCYPNKRAQCTNIHHNNCCHPLDKKSPVPVNHGRPSKSNVGDITKYYFSFSEVDQTNHKRESFPVGCLPPALLFRGEGGFCTTPLDTDPRPWRQTPLDADPPPEADPPRTE